ncbi:MAG: Hsp70 family protein [Anaerolineae bacterium]|nr:Hsp70 family protein [Anaerolineae bacterium]
MRIGLDFGTTNSSAALYHDDKLTVFTSPATEIDGILPSLIYITRDHEVVLGKAAARRYLRDDTGRPAVWETRHAGIIEYWVSIDMPSMLGGRTEPVLIRQDVFVQEDINASGRLLQAIKTALRNPAYAGTAVFDKTYTIEDLIALLLRELRTAATARVGKPVDAVLLGRPVTFNDSQRDDARAEAILRAAAHAAGFSDVQFMLEPIAAAYSYHVRLPERHTALVFDFGGGTLDLTLAEIGGQARPVVLATHGLLLGGDDFDRRIMEKFLWKSFGYDKPYENGYRLSYEIYDYLLDWSRHPDMTRLDAYTQVRRAALVTKAGPEFTALLSLVENKHGFALFEAIEESKIALSSQEETTLQFQAEGIAIHKHLTRQRFARSIQDMCARIEETIGAVLEEADLAAADVDLVLCTGGSSAVPAVQAVLAARFGSRKLRRHDPFLSVSSGLAIAATMQDVHA